MSQQQPANDQVERVAIATTRTVTITDSDGRPSLQLVATDDNVLASPLPKNSGKRTPVRLADLKAAVDTLFNAANR